MLLKFLLAAVIFSSSCFAAMADWDVAEFSRTRLVFDFNDKAGIHIKMQPGWKTYWRKPGDGGIAPHFDWSGSGNVKTVSVLYPVPHRFEDGYSTSIGYEKEVVFPLLVEPEEPGRPVELQLNVSYAICGKLCVPVVSRLRGTPNSGTYKDHNTLEHFTRLLPKQLLSPPSELKIKSVLDGKSPYLRIDAPKNSR
jgi:DsbC/DsbD-like thiol-disulfide interchange protein